MARLKSHYKKFADGGAVGLDVHPDLQVDIDDPSAAFQRQIDALRNAEAAQRDLQKAFDAGDIAAQRDATDRISRANTLAAEQHQRTQQAPPQHQLTERQLKFITDHPEMVAEPLRLKQAIISAHMGGHEIDSEAFHKHVADAFRIQHLEVAAHNSASFEHQPGTPEHHRAASDSLDKLISDVNDEPPKIFRPKPRPEPSMGGIVSAPVSREGTMAIRGGGGDYQSDNPGRITLTAAEKEIARALGQSEVNYAKGKIELARRKSEGFYDR